MLIDVHHKSDLGRTAQFAFVFNLIETGRAWSLNDTHQQVQLFWNAIVFFKTEPVFENISLNWYM